MAQFQRAHCAATTRFHRFESQPDSLQWGAAGFCLIIGALLCSQPASAVGAQATSLEVGPFLQQITPTGAWVVWETDAGSESTVDYGLSTSLGSTASGSSFVTGGGTVLHQTEIAGLQPDTLYYYRIKTDSIQSPILHLRTAPDPASEKAFRFLAYSDTQGNGAAPSKHTEVINDGMISYVTSNFGSNLSDELAFVIHAGDLVGNGNNYGEWKTQFFDEAQNLYQYVPLYPAIGNHEGNSPYYFDYFKLPENGTPAYLEHWYYVDYSNVRVIAMDTNGGYRIQAQLNWLQTVLDDAAAEDTIDFVFAHFHHPHHSEMWSPGNTAYTGQIIEKMETFSAQSGKPSVHFFGHTHAYSRGQSQNHQHVMVNVASGEGYLDYWGIVPPIDYPEYQRSFIDWGFVLMEVQAGADPQFRLRRISRGSDAIPRDNDVLDDMTVRRYNTRPDTPSAVSPAPASQGVDPDLVTLQASAYAGPAGLSLLESQFQLTQVQGDFSSPIIDQWLRVENWYAPSGGNSYDSVNTVDDPDITKLEIETLEPGTTYYWRVRYRDMGLTWSEWSESAAFTTVDRNDVVLLEEDFDSIPLQVPVDEEAWTNDYVWTNDPPADWSIDNTGVPTIGDPTMGVTEWEGWSFVVPDCWVDVSGDQLRSQFTKGSGLIAVADPDEWDDKGNPETIGTYNTLLSTPEIDLTNVAGDSVTVAFDSSWRPEDNQTAVLSVSLDGGAPLEVFRWESQAGAHYKPDATNESLNLNINNPASASSMTLTFAMLEAGNDWWWAFDNLVVQGNRDGTMEVLLSENFDSLVREAGVDENFTNCDTSGTPAPTWSPTPPAGWTTDNSGVPGVGTANDGVTEWAGWAFTRPDWWTSVAQDQGRSGFTRGQGVIAVADPDEWDDLPHASGTYNTLLHTPSIDVSAILANSVRVRFDSSWVPEDNQTATISASFDGQSSIEIARWESQAGEFFKSAATNERMILSVPNPPGAHTMQLTFAMLDAGNDWWWAIDNLEIIGVACTDPTFDFDLDGDVDQTDFGVFQHCLTSEPDPVFAAGCNCADVDGDLDVDQDDLQKLLDCLNGANVSVDPDCDDLVP